ncbi:MAG TPA: sugar ABC transporter ATP-binding protein [Anaerovoracaceae bacterium]|nr:sugar ABC transporter ATP-binding protein [Anaerovoracaceae bacterium]
MDNDVFIELKNITKYFPGVVALKNMSFQVRRGEVHGLIGENGAGKSTLIKTLSGVNQPDEGQILINGKPVVLSNPNAAKQHGIGCVYQELNIVQQLSITDNLFIGYYIKGVGPFLDYKKMHGQAREIMKSLGQDIDPRTECGKLGMGLKQTVEIGKSILMNSRLIIMDEPTSSLSETEVKQLQQTVKMLKEQGISIIFVSHKLEEIFQLCDVVTVMRDGQHVGTVPVSEVTKEQLIADMVGRSLDNLFPKQIAEKGEELLRVEHLKEPGVINDISFSAYGGQILGFSGLVGAGRTETLRGIFGADPVSEGEIYIKGSKTEIKNPRDAIANRIAFVTEDRKKEGLIIDASVNNNLNLAIIDRDRIYRFFLNLKKLKNISLKNVEMLRIKTSSLETPVGTLSGGNQQKVVIGKWINTDADIFFFDEPTRGIDVGAKVEVYNVMNELVGRGKCVIMVSSELPEILGMSDRVLVFRGGRIMTEIERSSEYFNQEDIMKAAWGGTLS